MKNEKEKLKESIINEMIKLLESKPLNQITIKELTNNLEISRQAFYYYFSDLLDVVDLIYSQASDRILEDYSSISNWTFGYLSMMNWVLNHKKIVIHTYKSIEREYVDNFLYGVLYSYIEKIVETQAKGINVTEEQKNLLPSILHCHLIQYL